MCLETLKVEVRKFVDGYLAGSSNSYDQAFEVLKEEHIDIHPATLITLYDQAIEDAEIFDCENCGWWCWEYERSPIEGSYCKDCSGECEDE